MTAKHRFGLSKSRIASFEQCPKCLWLSVHRPECGQQEGAAARFATGHGVGEIACALLPDGVMIEAVPDFAAALAATQALLDKGDRPIFEATFQHDGVLVRVDVLQPDGAGGWHIAEVKSSTRAKDYHLADLATQIWVVRNSGVPVSSAAIRHINSGFVLEREGAFDGLFTDTHLMAAAEPLVAGRGEIVAAAREVLHHTELEISPGSHCDAPFSCEFAGYCNAALPVGPEWPVTILPNGGGKRWIEQGVVDLLAVAPGALTNPTHQRVWQATVSGQLFHDPAKARAEIESWAFPRT